MLLPMFAMFMWIWIMILYALYHRINAVRTGKLKAWYFKTFSGTDAPEWILKQNRQITNLFEVPPLFLITCLTVIVLKIEDPIFIALGWGFVGTRVIHSVIHVGINHVIYRLSCFALSSLVLVGMWIRILILAA